MKIAQKRASVWFKCMGAVMFVTWAPLFLFPTSSIPSNEALSVANIRKNQELAIASFTRVTNILSFEVLILGAGKYFIFWQGHRQLKNSPPT